MRQVFVVCGPTASGKSSYALRLAQRIGGVIINADALQVYKQLKIITCCPAEVTGPKFIAAQPLRK